MKVRELRSRPGLDPPPSIDRALVLGGGSTLWADIYRLRRLYGRPWDGAILATNDAGYSYGGRIDYWVSLHPGRMADFEYLREMRTGWLERRHRLGLDFGFEVWGGAWRTGRDDLDRYPWVDRSFRCGCVGSTGFHAAEAAADILNARRVVLAGVPLTATPHFFSRKPWEHAYQHRECFVEARDRWDDRVRSLSGWTARTLGEPETEWLRAL